MFNDDDLQRTRQIFFDECREQLVTLEDCVLELEASPNDTEMLNALFRVAHTIKGAAGLFGLVRLVCFAHVMENVLEQLRSGHLAFDRQLGELLLACRDHLAVLVDASASGYEVNVAQEDIEASLTARLLSCLGVDTKAQAFAPATHLPAAAPLEARVAADWDISAQFGPDAFRYGFDPLATLNYLHTLGEVSAVAVNLQQTPPFAELDAESCYLGFRCQLHTDVGEGAIREAFDFVVDDCEFSIVPRLDHTQVALQNIAAMPPDVERVGDIMLLSGAISDQALQRALATQHAQHRAAEVPQALGQILIAQGAAPANVVNAALGQQQKVREQKTEEGRFVRVHADKLDQLIQLVGRLVIAGAGCTTLARAARVSAVVEANADMARLVEEIRDSALKMRMVPVGESFSRFRRVVRDVCASLGKEVTLNLIGGDTELDKTLVDRIADPLMHLVRNALDHGIETPDQRLASGKPASAQLTLQASHDSGFVVLQIRDDGRGIDPQRIFDKAVERGMVAANATLSHKAMLDLIFAPGFSTAEAVTDLSGRGVGMDVVKRNIESMRGVVSVESTVGVGTTVEIRLPLTLAIIDGFLVRVGKSVFAIPLDVVEECIDAPDNTLHRGGQQAAAHYMSLRGNALPVVETAKVFGLQRLRGKHQSIVVVRHGQQRAGLLVDQLLGEYQTVIKPLGRMLRTARGISGSTILGTGEVALILDVPALIGMTSEWEAAQWAVQ